ncbi:protein SHORT HYPOCOTYL IN WHITE LIGHT 1 [Senna tora]|uniref:Protein SHORT HYPOCOTYL IN WHITE LIGHT 1 n=1 Tax=Senna tora TaxID=362788 RepID=A0A834SWL3_9FABA|nr:protein SHORT HYPOCOTYL IN WHITE LIGHT 1 [Senna tora]
MAGASATPAPLINLTLHSSTKLLHFSANVVPFPRQVFRPRFCFSSPSNPRINNCYGKLNNSTEGEADDIDEALFGGYDEVEDENDEEDAESSVDLLVRFLQSMFKKVSKRAKKASRSVLPAVISPQLVSFAVDGTLLLASLSIVKAFLEVICTLGGTVFAGILLLRVIWAAVAYFQSSGNSFNQGGSSFGAVA